MLRCPLGLERLIRVTEQGTVIYLAEKKACRRFPKPASGDLFGGVSPGVSPGVARNFQVFDPLDFIAELTSSRLLGPHRPTQPAAGGPPSSSASGTLIRFDAPAADPP